MVRQVSGSDTSQLNDWDALKQSGRGEGSCPPTSWRCLQIDPECGESDRSEVRRSDGMLASLSLP